jgi:hypothetical protein
VTKLQSSTERKRTLAFLAKSRAREPTNLDADEQVAMVQVRLICVGLWAHLTQVIARHVSITAATGAAATHIVTDRQLCVPT